MILFQVAGFILRQMKASLARFQTIFADVICPAPDSDCSEGEEDSARDQVRESERFKRFVQARFQPQSNCLYSTMQGIIDDETGGMFTYITTVTCAPTPDNSSDSDESDDLEE